MTPARVAVPLPLARRALSQSASEGSRGWSSRPRYRIARRLLPSVQCRHFRGWAAGLLTERRGRHAGPGRAHREPAANPPRARWTPRALLDPGGRWGVSPDFGCPRALWDWRGGQPGAALEGPFDGAYAVSLSADGRRGATASVDNTLQVWDVPSGRLLTALRERAGNTVTLSPDGARVMVTLDEDPAVKIFPATSEVILSMACELLRYQPERAQVQGACGD